MYKKQPICMMVALAWLAVASVSSADNSSNGQFAPLRKVLTALASDSPGNSRAGVAVLDVLSGEEIYANNAGSPFNPASNAKVVTAACALKLLGPDFEYVTSLHGRVDGAVIRGPLYIKGHADPTLATKDLWSMVRGLVSAGVRRVEGGVVVDDSYFDDKNMPFAFDQQPDEDAAFRSPVGAVSLNHNALEITISAGPQAMSPGRVYLEPSGYAVLQNDSVTVAEGAHNPKISSVTYENRTKIRVWGNVPIGSRPATYQRRIDNPSLLSGYGLKSVIEESGITVGGGVQVGPMPPAVPMLAEHRSLPLSAILYETGKESNNFVTETVLKTIGAQSTAGKGPGTWEGAIKAVRDLLHTWGIDAKSYVYRNGSGLFDANRFSPRQFTQVLRAVYLDSRIRPEFLSQLAIGGVDGTIESRYKDANTMSLVRAKTGTLADVSTLTGYVFDAAGKRPIAFSILVNDAAGYVSAARAYQEKIVTAIAKFLNP